MSSCNKENMLSYLHGVHHVRTGVHHVHTGVHHVHTTQI